MRFVFFGFVLLSLFSGVVCKYDPTWESLDTRPIPLWYDDAKFGIFMHWGIYSSLGFEAWFWYWWKQDPKAEIVKFVKDNYPPDITYADFAKDFRAELFDAKQFAELVAASGARFHYLYLYLSLLKQNLFPKYHQFIF